MRSANNVGNAGPHVCQTFLNDVFTDTNQGCRVFFILLIFGGLFTLKDHLTHHNIFKYVYSLRVSLDGFGYSFLVHGFNFLVYSGW
jgi:hypothetical protein